MQVFNKEFYNQIHKEKNVELKNILQELSELAKLVIYETVDRMVEFLKKENKEAFYDKVEKAKNYKNGYILKLFLEKVSSLNNLTDLQKQMISYVEKLVS